MLVLDNILTDRGSRYAVSGGPARSADEARAFLKALRRRKKFARATHNSWGLLCDAGPLRNDDGESGAGLEQNRFRSKRNLKKNFAQIQIVRAKSWVQTGSV